MKKASKKIYIRHEKVSLYFWRKKSEKEVLEGIRRKTYDRAKALFLVAFYLVPLHCLMLSEVTGTRHRKEWRLATESERSVFVVRVGK